MTNFDDNSKTTNTVGKVSYPNMLGPRGVQISEMFR